MLNKKYKFLIGFDKVNINIILHSLQKIDNKLKMLYSNHFFYKFFGVITIFIFPLVLFQINGLDSEFLLKSLSAALLF